jgi:hypothetical protein
MERNGTKFYSEQNFIMVHFLVGTISKEVMGQPNLNRVIKTEMEWTLIGHIPRPYYFVSYTYRHQGKHAYHNLKWQDLSAPSAKPTTTPNPTPN